VDADTDGGLADVRARHAGSLVGGLHQPGPTARDDVAAHPRQLRGQVADRRIGPVAGIGPGRPEDRHAVALSSSLPEPGQVIDDLPQAEHGLRDDLDGRLFVAEPDDLGRSDRTLWIAHESFSDWATNNSTTERGPVR